MNTNQQTQKPEQPPYVLAHLLCGCTVMQRQEANPGLFYLLQHLEKKPVILYCPEHRRQKVARLITRARKWEHWPSIERVQCSFCEEKMTVPPPPSEGDEPTMPNKAHGQDSVYVPCPTCSRWGSYGFAETAETRYDYVYAQTTCPNCYQGTLVHYNPYTSSTGEEIPSKCVSCKRPFVFVVQNHRDRVAVKQHGEDLFTLYAEEWAQIEHHIMNANEGLLGLHRYGAMSYEQYTNIADLLVEARERLKKQLKGQNTEES